MEELDIQKFEKLARLKLSDNERKEMEQHLHRMIAYVELLQEVDTSSVERVETLADIEQPLRSDVCEPWLSNSEALANAPASSAGYFSVPKVISSST